MPTTTEARKQALFARTSTPTLVTSALSLDARAQAQTIAAEERLTLAWINDELERRMGGITDDDAFDALIEDLTYVEALLVTFPALAGEGA